MEQDTAAYTQEFLHTIFRIRKNLHSLNISDKLLRVSAFAMIFIGFYTSPEKNNGQGVKISDLSRIIGISRPGVTKMLNSLEDNGYVTKSSTKEDRRYVFVKLTPIGYEMLTCMNKTNQVYMKKIINRLGVADFEKLLELLNKVCDIFPSDSKNYPI